MATRERKLGRADGIRWAITYVHQRAEEMNDLSARAALNVVANDMGGALKAAADDAALEALSRKDGGES
jgi:hypothetical protein